MTVYGPDQFPPTSDTVEIDVAKPLPFWISNLYWLIPLGAGCCFAFAKGVDLLKRQQVLSQLSKLNGTLRFREGTNQWRSAIFAGDNREEVVCLHGEDAARVSAVVDPVTSERGVLIELVDSSGEIFQSGECSSGQRTKIGNFDFQFDAA